MTIYAHTINSGNDIAERFRAYGRYDSFSRAGYDAIFDFLEIIDYEGELDVIALDCAYSEHESAIEALNDHGYDCDTEDEEEALEWLHDRTTVLQTSSGSVIIGVF